MLTSNGHDRIKTPLCISHCWKTIHDSQFLGYVISDDATLTRLSQGKLMCSTLKPHTLGNSQPTGKYSK